MDELCKCQLQKTPKIFHSKIAITRNLILYIKAREQVTEVTRGGNKIWEHVLYALLQTSIK